MTSLKENYGVTRNGAYLMNAAIGGVHIQTAKEIKKWTELCFNRGAIGDERFFHLLTEARTTAANFIGLKPEEVAYSGSTSLNMNLLAMMLKNVGVKKIVAPEVEFPSSVVPWFHQGFDVKLIKEREKRIWESELIDAAQGEDTAIVCSGVQFLTGQRLDLKLLGEETHKKGIKFIINATQFLGQFPLDLSQIKFTAMTASLHKWLGADLGLSLLAMNRESFEQFKSPIAGWTGVHEPWRLANESPDLLDEMGVFQVGTVPFNMIAGARKAMEVQENFGKELIESRVLENSNYLRDGLLERGYELHSEGERSGICTFRISGDLEKHLKQLESKKVFVNGRRGCLRASVHFYNDKADMDLFLNELVNLDT